MKSFINKSILVYLLIVIISPFVLLTTVAFAQTPAPTLVPVLEAGSEESRATYTLLAPLPCTETSGDCSNGVVTRVTLVTYLNQLFKLSIGLAAVLAVFMIVWGGFQYVTTDAITGKSDAKETITRALEGLVMVLASYFILYTINPKYVQMDPNVITPLCDPKNPIDSVCNTKKFDPVSIQQNPADVAKDAQLQKNSARAKAQLLDGLAQDAYEAGDIASSEKYTAQAIEQEKIALAAETKETVANNYQQILDAVPTVSNPEKLTDIEAHLDEINRTYAKAISEFTEKGDPEKVKALQKEQISTDISIRQTVSIKMMNDELQSGAGSSNIQNARDIKKKYLDDSTKAYRTLEKIDPVDAENLRLKTVEDLKQIDATISYRERCPTDKIYHPLEILKGSLFGPVGAVGAMYATAEKCK